MLTLKMDVKTKKANIARPLNETFVQNVTVMDSIDCSDEISQRKVTRDHVRNQEKISLCNKNYVLEALKTDPKLQKITWTMILWMWSELACKSLIL